MANNKQNKIVVILGPTSSGKSDVAIRLAKKLNGEIISADSRQVYRGLDIGSGKEPGVFDEGKKVFISSDIPHHMIDVASPRADVNAATFKKKSDKIIAGIIARGKLPIICGGTGFWIKAIVDNVAYPAVKPDLALREKLSRKSKEELFAELQKLDPERARTIDRKNPVRLIRALEICRTLGKVPALPKNREPKNENYEFFQIGINIPKEILRARIRKRLKKRFSAGMIEEVIGLHDKNKVSWERLESFGLGYRLIPMYLKKEIDSTEELFEKIYLAEVDYAKRQMTWFKKDKRIWWLEKYRDIEKEVRRFIG